MLPDISDSTADGVITAPCTQSAAHRQRPDAVQHRGPAGRNRANVRPMDRPWLRGVFVQSEMRSALVIVVHEATEVVVKAAFTADDHVISSRAAGNYRTGLKSTISNTTSPSSPSFCNTSRTSDRPSVSINSCSEAMSINRAASVLSRLSLENLWRRIEQTAQLAANASNP